MEIISFTLQKCEARSRGVKPLPTITEMVWTLLEPSQSLVPAQTAGHRAEPSPGHHGVALAVFRASMLRRARGQRTRAWTQEQLALDVCPPEALGGCVSLPLKG